MSEEDEMIVESILRMVADANTFETRAQRSREALNEILKKLSEQETASEGSFTRFEGGERKI